MVNKALSPHKLRSRVARELGEFAEILLKVGVCSDPSPLHRASSNCLNYKNEQWGYSFSGLTLHVGQDVKCVPTNISDFVCRLDVSIEGTTRPKAPQSDPLTLHQVEIELKSSDDADPSCSFLQAWHLDRHPDSAVQPNPAHPRYHLSFGGHRMEAHLPAGKKFFEGILLLDSPRLSHPPLDGVLAVDFILSHFAGSIWRLLYNDVSYRRIVRNSQDMLWKPYALALYAPWSTDHASKKVWPIEELWPQFLDLT